MKKCIMTSTTLVALAVVRICGFASSSHESKAFEPTAHAFFPFCIDWHDAKKRLSRKRRDRDRGSGPCTMLRCRDLVE